MVSVIMDYSKHIKRIPNLYKNKYVFLSKEEKKR